MPINDERINRLEREIGELEHQVEALRRKEAEVDVRFGNGREVMKDLRADVEKLKPKAHSLIRLAGIAAGITITALNAQNWLQGKLDERPKEVEVERLLHEHVDHGHESTTRDLTTLQETVMSQGAEIKLCEQRLESLERGKGRLDLIRQGLTTPK